MHNKFWTPIDNKFVTELQVLIEQVKSEIKKMESESRTNDISIEAVDIKIETLNSIANNLQNSKTKIVSLKEYKNIQFAISKLTHDKWIYNQKKIRIAEMVGFGHRRIEELKAKIEKVKFKLLEFKKREED